MNFRKRFIEITDFLKPYQTIWQNEILLLYPTPLLHYPASWLEDLSRFSSKEDVLRLERKEVEGLIEDPGLKAFYERMKELIDIPVAGLYPGLPADHLTFLYMIPKKQHEIRQLAPILNQIYQKSGVDEVIDIGGGIGLLAQTLVNYYGMKVCSLDLDPVLQDTGLKRHMKNAKNPENMVNYKQVKVELSEAKFVQLLSGNKMTVGLHTCGPLAVSQLSASAGHAVKRMVNFGCCYHKLEDFPEAQNISKFARENSPLTMSRYALTLSARAHRKLDEKEFDLKLKVKVYRYAIHFLLHDHYKMEGFLPLGNSKPELYDESFGTYVLEQLSRINVKPLHTKEELDYFFINPERQLLISKMLAGGIVRDAMGRLLELYILLDRVIFMEEHGYKVELLQCFDEVISPRNLGIFCELN
ncbi:MAG TPA: methyltransferase [Bacteriovoracaceae bacterium]|nr:methyltransferase [Bacteriovoracaceae bacterium]